MLKTSKVKTELNNNKFCVDSEVVFCYYTFQNNFFILVVSPLPR